MSGISLNQFGAVVSFAINLEKTLEKIYCNPNLHKTYKRHIGEFEKRASASKKRAKNLERTRRENITEITLEPIEGLHADDYKLTSNVMSLDEINSNENSTIQFYKDASSKLNVLETKRLFKKYLKDHSNLKPLSSME